MKKINIFDIDGTILPSIFPNMQENDKPIDQIIKDVLERSHNVVLYPEFIRYYSKHCTNSSENIFLTGRQERPFGNLTHLQLTPLKELSPFYVIFYPEEKSYLSKEYFSWKTQEIYNLFIKNKSYNNANQVKCIIYDDQTDYFNSIRNLAKNLKINISLRPIKTSSDWIL